MRDHNILMGVLWSLLFCRHDKTMFMEGLFMKNNQIEAYIFDLDGTVYLGDQIIPGAKEVLEQIREKDVKVRFVTNNPLYNAGFFVNKLSNLGIPAEADEIVTSAQITAAYLKNNPKYGKVFIMGSEQLQNKIQAAGVELADVEPDTVVVSLDTTLTYKKLMIAYHALKKGAHFIATHPDVACPTPEGGLVDAGAIIAALEASTSRKVEKIIGKPSLILGDLLLADLGLPAENCVIIGDRLNTDVRLGNKMNMRTVWIRSHNEDLPIKSKDFPDHTVTSISEIPAVLQDYALV